jgi:hypothetical protein
MKKRISHGARAAEAALFNQASGQCPASPRPQHCGRFRRILLIPEGRGKVGKVIRHRPLSLGYMNRSSCPIPLKKSGLK